MFGWTLNQKAAVMATLELRLENLRKLLETEKDPYTRQCFLESLGELTGAYMFLHQLKPIDLKDDIVGIDGFSVESDGQIGIDGYPLCEEG